MLPTEVQRILLLIGLAATGYLMILAWNDDFIQNKTPTAYQAPEPESLLEGLIQLQKKIRQQTMAKKKQDAS